MEEVYACMHMCTWRLGALLFAVNSILELCCAASFNSGSEKPAYPQSLLTVFV
jgi:hypothetical protein